MFEYLEKFKRAVIISLTFMMALVLLLSTIELGWLIIKEIGMPPLFFSILTNCSIFLVFSCWS